MKRKAPAHSSRAITNNRTSPTTTRPRGRWRTARPDAKEESRRIAELETKLSETRDHLQYIQEQHEAADEALQSANKELLALNEEMASRNAELKRLNSDLTNLQTSTHLGIVLLGRDLTIRRFSAQAEKQFGLTAADVGRFFGHVQHDFVFTKTDSNGHPLPFEDLIAQVIASERECEREICDSEGHWYSLCVRPYFTLDSTVDGAVLLLADIDALKRSEQAIIAARDYAEAIVRTTRDPLLILSADLRVHTANEAFYNVFKVGAAETEGRSIYDLGNGQWNIPRLHELLEEMLARNSFFDNLEVTHDFETIGRRTMLLNARALRETGAGHRAQILLGIQDVTEVLQFQVAAQESAEKFKLLFERSPLPHWAFELGTLRFVDVNESAVKQYGYSREEFLQMTVLDVRVPKASETLQAGLARPPNYLPERDFCQHRKKSGEVVDVEVTGSEIRLQGKRVWLASVADITERKRAEAALSEAGERLRFVVESMPQKIFTATADGDVDYLNERWTEFTGAARGHLRHSRWTHFIHADDAAENVRVWHQSIATGRPFHFEHRIKRADGEYRWHLSRAVAFKDANGKILMWIGSSTDIHEVKEADRRKVDFLALLAHELRGPLAPLFNMLEVMKRAEGNEALKQQARRTMERQLGHMTRLIEDLLDVSRISRGRLELRREQVELASVVHQVVESLSPAIESAKHDLMVALPAEPLYVDGDPARLVQIFSNLLTNACKYSGAGSPIWLTAERQGRDLIVSVRDTGIGIPPDMLSKIFDMFTQVGRSSERSQGGLGIGLALVRQLTQMHGGSVTVSSEGPARGSEFVVRLPAGKRSRNPNHANRPPANRLPRLPAASSSWTTTRTRRSLSLCC